MEVVLPTKCRAGNDHGLRSDSLRLSLRLRLSIGQVEPISGLDPRQLILSIHFDSTTVSGISFRGSALVSLYENANFPTDPC